MLYESSWRKFLTILFSTLKASECVIMAGTKLLIDRSYCSKSMENVIIIVWGSNRRFLEQVNHTILSQIEISALNNKITISLEKSTAIKYRKPKVLKQTPTFKTFNLKIKDVKIIPYLGVTFDKHLSFLP